MMYSKRGIIAQKCLMEIPMHFANVCLSAYVVMPNHVHILFHVETPDLASLQDNRRSVLIKYDHKNHPGYYSRINQKSKQLIPKIIQQYKSSVTRKINPKILFFAWQSGFYDEIIIDQKRLNTINYYIRNNVASWNKDKLKKRVNTTR